MLLFLLVLLVRCKVDPISQTKQRDVIRTNLYFLCLVLCVRLYERTKLNSSYLEINFYILNLVYN